LKKIFAIAMLCLMLFNLGGYAVLFQYVIYRSDAAIIENINHNRYKSAELVEVKIPVHLTTEDWHEYAVISGQVQLKDHSYNYAELKLTRDTMYLLCIPNSDKSRLINANIIYAKQVNDIPLNKKSHIPPIKKSIEESEYLYYTLTDMASLQESSKKPAPDYNYSAIIKIPLTTPGQPPESLPSNI
jgi:hypothetical protein